MGPTPPALPRYFIVPSPNEMFFYGKRLSKGDELAYPAHGLGRTRREPAECCNILYFSRERLGRGREEKMRLNIKRR